MKKTQGVSRETLIELHKKTVSVTIDIGVSRETLHQETLLQEYRVVYFFWLQS